MSERMDSGAEPVFGRRIAIVISLVSGAVAIAGAWLRPVWHDELYTLLLARLPLDELMSALVVDSGPPLHYLLCHILFVLVGWQEGSVLGTLAVRLPSVLAFALLPWVVWRGRSVGVGDAPWGPLLVVVWLPLVYFGTEGRAYALLALVNALVWIRGPQWIERGRTGAVGFGVVAASLPLLHYTGWASFLALPALALFVAPERRRTLMLTLTGAALPGLLWLPVMVGAPSASMDWLVTVSGAGRPGLATLSVMAPAGPFPALFEASALPVPAWASCSVLALVVAGALIGGWRLRRDDLGDTASRRSAAQLGTGLLPAVALAGAALAGVPLYFAGRTESMVWALAASLVAILIHGLPPLARGSVVTAYLLVGASTVALWLADLPGRRPMPGVEVGRELAGRLEEGDRLVVAGLWQLEVRHGLAERILEGATGNPLPIDVETIPRSQAEHPGWLDRAEAISPRLLDEARALRDSGEGGTGRIWLVWSPVLPLEETFFPAFSGWRRARVARSPIIAVDLLTLEPAETPSAAVEGDGQ